MFSVFLDLTEKYTGMECRDGCHFEVFLRARCLLLLVPYDQSIPVLIAFNNRSPKI